MLRLEYRQKYCAKKKKSEIKKCDQTATADKNKKEQLNGKS